MSYQPGTFSADAIYTDPYKVSSSMPTGEWNMIANGRIYKLDIEKGPGNTIQADMHSGEIVDATFNAATGAVEFTRILPDKNRQLFVGYLMHSADQDPSWRIAGTFDQPNLSASSSWYATIAK